MHVLVIVLCDWHALLAAGDVVRGGFDDVAGEEVLPERKAAEGACERGGGRVSMRVSFEPAELGRLQALRFVIERSREGLLRLRGITAHESVAGGHIVGMGEDEENRSGDNGSSKMGVIALVEASG